MNSATQHRSWVLGTTTFGVLTVAVISTLLMIAGAPAQAQTESVLYSFGSQAGDGAQPFAGLIMDKEGNLYGTTEFGVEDGHGTVFELSPTGTETVLHSFEPNGTDGNYPHASLIRDKKRNLYGTTLYGGTYGERHRVQARSSWQESRLLD